MENILTPELCAEKHKHIEEDLKQHGQQIDTLVKSDASNTANLNILMKCTYALFGTVLTALVGFAVWYLQQL
jgi:hypothetical protein